MTFNLPSWPGFIDIEPFEISKNTETEVILNGEQQRFLRPGSRMGVRLTLPPMDIDDARLWVAALLRASREMARVEWPQPGLDPGDPGAPVISAASSANATVIAIGGLAPGYAILAGQAFNQVKAGQSRLHFCVQTGTTPLIIAPPLRKPAVVGDVLNLANPVIEGLVDGPATWKVDAAAIYGITFTIREAS